MLRVSKRPSVTTSVQCRNRSPGSEAHGANLGLDLLRFCAEDFLQDISLGVVFRLALIDLAVSKKPADIGIVFGDLFHAAALVVARAEIE